MWMWLLGLSVAGSPRQACAIDPDGQVVFLSPADGRAFQVREDGLPHVLARVPVPEGGVQQVIVPDPAGGWWIGAVPTHHLDPDGTLRAVPDPRPEWVRALDPEGWPSFAGPRGVILLAEVDAGGVVGRATAEDAQTFLWDFDNWAQAPRGLYDDGTRVISLRDDGIVVYPDQGSPTTLPLPAEPTVGVCAAAGGPLHAVTRKGRHQVACLHRHGEEGWTELFCVE